MSEPLIIENPIKGETLAVFDRNYNKTFRVASYFGRSEIRISEHSMFQGRFGGRSTTGSNDVTSLAKEVTSFEPVVDLPPNLP